jgi:hypothetical protein
VKSSEGLSNKISIIITGRIDHMKFFKGFIALIRAGHTCSVTKLFLNNNQFTTVLDNYYR